MEERSLVIELVSYCGDDTRLIVDMTGRPETDRMYCILTLREDGTVDDALTDYGYRSRGEAETLVREIAALKKLDEQRNISR